ncbi:replication initiation and membrane attachment family protein [Bacillus marasmi]|uniref:replication initiation and membrane attachment family protein n=1 Tax=Bacillus marasmi TaxID=1926279 RepID=UPI0011C98EBD|nr:DnaD domain protein [Bacillus marasmi]
MAYHWQEVVPQDRYLVALKGLLHEYDRKVLTFLYQPIIGATSLSLYMTLWAEIEGNRLWSEPKTHYFLMDIMGLQLNEIYEARIKLEGINLLTTLVRNNEEGRDFIYQLMPPKTPEQFFSSDLLNVPLSKNISDTQYKKLQHYFSNKSAEAFKEFENVSKDYDEIFEFVSPKAIESARRSAKIPTEMGNEYVGRKETGEIEISQSYIDFDILMAGLSENIVPKSALTEEVIDAINKLSFLYGIDAIEMKNLLMDATDNGITNIDVLRDRAQIWYELYQGGLPTLVDRTQPTLYKEEMKEHMTEEDKFIHYLETTSPRKFLKDQGGGEPSKVDLKLIEDIMFQKDLPSGVINVLIDYVMKTNDMKLPKSLTDKIASHWARKKVKRVKDAMQLARSEYKKYEQWAPRDTSKNKRTTTKKPIRTELLPEWFHEKDSSSNDHMKTNTNKPLSDNNQPSSGQNQSELDDSDFEAKKRALEEKIKNMRK